MGRDRLQAELLQIIEGPNAGARAAMTFIGMCALALLVDWTVWAAGKVKRRRRPSYARRRLRDRLADTAVAWLAVPVAWGITSRRRRRTVVLPAVRPPSIGVPPPRYYSR